MENARVSVPMYTLVGSPPVWITAMRTAEPSAPRPAAIAIARSEPRDTFHRPKNTSGHTT